MPFSWLRIKESALAIINKRFDSMLGANSGGHQKSEISKDHYMHYMHGSKQ